MMDASGSGREARSGTAGAPDYLAVRGLAKSYGAHRAVAGIDLDIAEGEFVALLGPSGCGKTTLLRCIAGLVEPSAGDIRIAGRSIVKTPVWRRDLGMVFQSYALFPHMSVERNVAFGLKMRGIAKGEAGERVARALDLVRMGDYADRLPGQLSGGQQQRVALARALVTNPSVLLLDEPLGALDAKLREAMQVELRQLQRQLGVTTVFVTHDQQEALGMADRIAVMRAGRIEQFGTARAIYDAPLTPFVADFIGQMNALRGRLVDRDGGVARIGVAQATLEAPDSGRATTGEPVLAMLRPEKIDLVAPGDGKVDGRLVDLLFTGEKVTYFVETALGRLTATARNDGRRGDAVAPGTAVGLDWAPGDIHIFADDRESRNGNG